MVTEKSKVLKAKSRVGMVILRVVKEFEGGAGEIEGREGEIEGNEGEIEGTK